MTKGALSIIDSAAASAPFQARVASVTLVTTVAILLAAASSFMLQQWAVSREEGRESIAAVSAVVAQIAAPAVLEGDTGAAVRAAQAAVAASSVVRVRIVNMRGRTLAEAHRPRSNTASHEVRTAIMYEGAQVGTVIVHERRSMLALLPRYAALTFALFFGGTGLALFLARALSRRVTAPVMRLSLAMDEFLASGTIRAIDDEADDDLFRSLAHKFNLFLTRVEPKQEQTLPFTTADAPSDVLPQRLSDRYGGQVVLGEPETLVTLVGTAAEREEIRAPRWGWFVLALVCPRDQLETISGDIEEKFRQCFAERGASSANWFYLTQIARSILPLLWHALRGLVSLARLFRGG